MAQQTINQPQTQDSVPGQSPADAARPQPTQRILHGVVRLYKMLKDMDRRQELYLQDPTQRDARNMPEPFAIFRAVAAGGDISRGAAMRILPMREDRGRCLFVEMAHQKPERTEDGYGQFAWDHLLRFQLGRADVSQVLAYIDGWIDNNDTKHNCRALYHNTSTYTAQARDNAMLSLAKQENGAFNVRLSKQWGNGKGDSVQVSMAPYEVYEMRLLLQDWAVRRYNWGGNSVLLPAPVRQGPDGESPER